MLPYSPLHHILLNDFGAPLVATSANISGEPVLTENDDIEQRLAHVANAFLHHNRPIVRPADDPVIRVINSHPAPIRQGRGLAPVEIETVLGPYLAGLNVNMNVQPLSAGLVVAGGVALAGKIAVAGTRSGSVSAVDVTTGKVLSRIKINDQ